MDRTPPPDGKGAPPDGARPARRKAREFVPRGDRSPDPIVRNLKLAYEEVASEPLPDDLAALVAQIESMDLKGGRHDDR